MFLPPLETTPELGAGLILCTEQPFYLGKVHRFKNDSESMRFLTNNPPMVYSNVLGYGIYIAFYGSLTNNVRVTGSDFKSELQEVFDQMAAWYYKEKILPKKSFYKRFEV